MDTDVVLIGAGALGLTTALHCAMSGRSVAVVERHTVGSQASGRAAGLFKSVQADELRTRLARRSIDQAVTFAEWTGTPLAVTRPGSFLIARTARHREFLQRELAQSQRWGVDVCEAGPPASRAPLSYYHPAGQDCALWCPEDVYIEEPASFIQACVAACRRHGAVVAENEPVIGIAVTAGRVTGVETEHRSITAPVVVDAAGAWVRLVAELAGARVPVAAVRHQLLITAPTVDVDPADPIVEWSTPPSTCVRPGLVSWSAGLRRTRCRLTRAISPPRSAPMTSRWTSACCGGWRARLVPKPRSRSAPRSPSTAAVWSR
jgi:glycine/D-amino acid oxidase-like deaminating enzyme